MIFTSSFFVHLHVFRGKKCSSSHRRSLPEEVLPQHRTMIVGKPLLALEKNKDVNTPNRRKHRRIASIWLNQRAVDGYTHVLDYEATTLLRELYRARATPINPQPHAGRCSLNNMLTITFATRTASVSDPLVTTALRLSREFM